MTNTDFSSFGLPTRQQVLAAKDRCEQLQQYLEELKRRHRAEEEKLQKQILKLTKFTDYGLELFELDVLPDAPHNEAVKPALAVPVRQASKKPVLRRKNGKSWTATIKRIVDGSVRGLSYAEVKESVAQTHLGETLQRTEKAFYGGIKKLCDRGDLIKYKGHLFTPNAHRAFMDAVAAGEVPDLEEPSGSGNGAQSHNEIAVLRFMETRPGGAETGQIVQSLLRHPPDDLSITKNRNSVYNLLSRMRDSGKLIRRGDRYYLPTDKDEAPDQGSSASSVRKDDGDGTPLFHSRQETSTLSTASPSATSAQTGK